MIDMTRCVALGTATWDGDDIIYARMALPALVQEVERLRAENTDLQRAVSRAENHWRVASEVDAAQALLACVSGAYEYGVQDGEFVAAYVTPTGPIHRAIVVLQALGIVARPRPQEVMPPALADRIAAEHNAAHMTDAPEEGGA